MDIQLGTVQIIITIIGSGVAIIAAVLGGFFAFYRMNKKEGYARTKQFTERLKEFEERQNRQRAEDIARQEAQRQEDREELREIKDQIYNHLPTQIKAVEDGLRTEMRETEKRIIDRINELFAAYLSKDKDEKTDKEEQDANAADERL